MTRRVPRGTLALGGLAAGVAVGFSDGLWAGLAAGADARGAVTAAVLTASVDGLLGVVAGMALEIVGRVALWGRGARLGRLTLAVGSVVLGAVAAASTIAVARAVIDRRNRFLAGGLTGLVAVLAGVVGAACLPALARALTRRRSVADLRYRPDPALLLLAPAAAAVIGVVVMQAAVGLTQPLQSTRSLHRLLLIGVEAGLLPGLLVWAERLPIRLRLRWAIPAALLAFGAPLVVFVVRNWGDHLRFLPWTHVIPGVLIVGVAIGNVPLVAPSLDLSARRRLGIGAAGFASMLLLMLLTSESELARKVTTAHAGFVGPVLASARGVLDRDRDGYSRWLGGGDCDDRDPTVHPGVLDFPDDGIDQDCDGKDASVSVLTPARFAPVPRTVPRDLNLLLITLDTVRADHLGCYGYQRPTSPAIDHLAAEGALFLNGWAHAPSTRYSMPAIATGRWPSAIKWDESIWWPRIAPGVGTLAEALKAEGYFTAAFYSYEYFSLTDRRGFERGVDLYRADRATLHHAVNGPMESHGSSSREIADDTIAFLEEHQTDKFFLWIHFYDPHLSYEPHPELLPSFGSSRVDLYDGEIRFTDLHVGRVLERLHGLGLWDRTAVVVTGDHGEGFGEHGVTEHGFDLYAAQTKVPLIVRVPGLAARRVVAPAGHVDLAPTLVNLARGSARSGFLGRSLVPELVGSSPSTPVAVFQEVTSERGKKRALVTEDLHLIWNWTPDNTTECYDYRADPGERRDLWGRSVDTACRKLKSDLQGMVSALSVPADVAQKLKGGVFPAGMPVPPPAGSLDATIGDVVKVAGYSVTPGVARPGGEIELAILFECKKTVTGGWRFFFHLMGPGGSFRNLDHVPVDGVMPPDRWRSGQRILDRLRIPFPAGTPRGPYNVIIGLYRGGDRLPIVPATLSDGHKALRLATIQVL
jgi:arylsulfatase A-like enzyme